MSNGQLSHASHHRLRTAGIDGIPNTLTQRLFQSCCYKTLGALGTIICCDIHILRAQREKIFFSKEFLGSLRTNNRVKLNTQLCKLARCCDDWRDAHTTCYQDTSLARGIESPGATARSCHVAGVPWLHLRKPACALAHCCIDKLQRIGCFISKREGQRNAKNVALIAWNINVYKLTRR